MRHLVCFLILNLFALGMTLAQAAPSAPIP